MTRRTLILTPFSKRLFDGKSFQNFRTPTGTTDPRMSWRIHDNALESIADARRQCDLWTVEEYDNFDLQFEWNIAPRANSGIKYLIQSMAVDDLKDAKGPFVHETSLGFEFQLIDDGVVDATRNPTHSSGALYNYLPPSSSAAYPAGRWNTARLIVKGESVEHWINSKRVLRFGLHSPELLAALAQKKLNSARMMERLERRKTPIAFQHHESQVAFRDIRIQKP